MLLKVQIFYQKDYNYAKQIFDNITQKMEAWHLLFLKELKIKILEILVTWIYLKETNKSSFDEYINFIEKQIKSKN